MVVLPAFSQETGNKPPQQPGPTETHSSATASRGRNLRILGMMGCPSCKLHGATLHDTDLNGSNFAGADLSEADLNKAKLNGAVLARGNLKNAKLAEADLTNADLTGADLSGADFTRAKLDGAIFEFANLECANLSGTNSTKAHFGVSLRIEPDKCRPKFNNATLSCEFHHDWNRIDTTGAILEECDSTALSTTYYCGATDVSGLKNVIYVSSTLGADSDTCGISLTQQCKTIQKGIERCSGADCSVLVAYDRYSPATTIALKDGTNVYGGCATLPQPQPAYVSIIQAPPGAPSVQAVNTKAATLFQGFTIFGSDTAKGAANLASIGFLAQSNSSLKLIYVRISAGTGGGGAAGSDGKPGNKGNNAKGQTAETNTCASSSNGGNGGQKSEASSNGHCCGFLNFEYCATCKWVNYIGSRGDPGSTGNRAAGGDYGSNVCYGCPETKRPGPAGAGQPGNPGGCPSGGSASSNTAGSIQNGVWVPSTGGSGRNGGDAGGGGGGGSGGSCVYIDCWGNPSAYPGVAGGGGGAGGCGGTAGGGGQQGGASIALMINGGGVALSNSTIVGGAGGSGGQGGNGREGGTGGVGASAPSSNPCNNQGGAGGTGGTGGTGGVGSGGAGGNGGPAFGIVTFSGGTFTQTATNFYQGRSGAFGGFGSGGSQSSGGSCPGQNGSSGLLGTVSDVQKF